MDLLEHLFNLSPNEKHNQCISKQRQQHPACAVCFCVALQQSLAIKVVRHVTQRHSLQTHMACQVTATSSDTGMVLIPICSVTNETAIQELQQQLLQARGVITQLASQLAHHKDVQNQLAGLLLGQTCLHLMLVVLKAACATKQCTTYCVCSKQQSI